MSIGELSILIPAAGASKRLGQAKQLVRYKAGPLIQNAVDCAHSIAPLEIIVITGANAKAVKDSVQGKPVRWIHNPRWTNGMGSSIAAGAAVINPGSRGVMILLCDQWKIQTSDLRLLAETWQSHPERIVCAQAQGRNMPPVIFPASCFSRLQALDGESGAREILQDHAGSLTAVPLRNADFDLDSQNHMNQLTKPGQ
jgi:molybdenum cofactor cytidylyltransferase